MLLSEKYHGRQTGLLSERHCIVSVVYQNSAGLFVDINYLLFIYFVCNTSTCQSSPLVAMLHVACCIVGVLHVACPLVDVLFL